MSTCGYVGKMLRVDLTNSQISSEEVSEEFFRRYMGSRGIGSRVLLDEVPKGADALGANNRVIVATGPLTGHPIPGATRVHFMAKSPLTGGYGESNAGGGFGSHLKRAGYDYVVIQGKAETPVYLWVHNGDAQLNSAEHIWGRVVGEAEDLIKAETSPDAVVACIGPAGEKSVPISAVVSERRRVAGRTGMGAVMGSKNLKAIAVLGRGRLPSANPDRVLAMARTVRDRLLSSQGKQNLSRYGTASGVSILNELGILPTKNFRHGQFEGHHRINGTAMAESILVKRFTCPGCPVACARGVRVDSGPFAPVDPLYGGPEYETLAALGSLCLVDNLPAIARAHHLCNAYGIDTISTGVIVAWVMECFERGVLTEHDLDGISVSWGNAEAMVAIVEKMCKQEGIGQLLSQGVRRASEVVGKGSQDYAVHVKGLEVALQEPRGKKGQGFGYAIGPRGACHTEVVPDGVFEGTNAFPDAGVVDPISRYAGDEAKGALVKTGQDIRILSDITGVCSLIFEAWAGIVPLDDLAGLVSAVTGWDCTVQELLTVSERATTLARAFNVREGFARQNDTLPRRFAEPLPDGASVGSCITESEIQAMADGYYRARGWDPNGIPTRAKLSELDLEDVVHIFDQANVACS